MVRWRERGREREGETRGEIQEHGERGGGEWERGRQEEKYRNEQGERMRERERGERVGEGASVCVNE